LKSQPSKIDQPKFLSFRTEKGKVELDIKLEKETIWLNQAQIAAVFGTDRTSITRHLSNIFKTGELEEKSNVQKMHISNSDRPVKFYSLDTIISVGYRVNSKTATQFRIWANSVLKQYLTKGYAIQEKALLTTYKHKLSELTQLVDFISAKANTALLENDTKGLIQFLQKYTKSIEVLEEFDTGDFKLVETQANGNEFSYDYACELIENLKQEVVRINPYNNLFGTDADKKLNTIISTINQTYDGDFLYRSIEEKAANLLYLIIKDHPFFDGNKRIGAMLFVYYLKLNDYFLDKNGKEKFSENALITLALLVASSNPNEKELMINLIIRLVQ
jgi:death-on-curing family protein